MWLDKNRKDINSKYMQLFILVAVVVGFMFFSASPLGEMVSGDAIRTIYRFEGETEFAFFNGGEITENMQGDINIEWDLFFRTYVTEADIDFGLFFYNEHGERHYVSEHEVSLGYDERTRGIGIYNSVFANRINLNDLVSSLHAYVNIAFADGTSYNGTHLLRVEEHYRFGDR